MGASFREVSFREWLFGCEHSICELWVFVLRVEHSFLWL